jgi:hypothetical protein
MQTPGKPTVDLRKRELKEEAYFLTLRVLLGKQYDYMVGGNAVCYFSLIRA